MDEVNSVIMPKAKTEDDDSDFSREDQVGVKGGKKVRTDFTKHIKKGKKYHSVHGAHKSKTWIMGKKDRAKK